MHNKYQSTAVFKHKVTMNKLNFHMIINI